MILFKTKSLRTKLFLLISILVMSTIIINTAQTSFSFKDYLETEIETNLMQQSNQSASLLKKILDSYRKIITTSIKTTLTKPKEERQEILRNIVDSNQNDIVSFQIIRQNSKEKRALTENFQFTKNDKDPKFEDKSLTTLKQEIENTNLKIFQNKVKSENLKGNQNYLVSLSNVKKIDLPLLSFAVTFPINNSNDFAIGIITFWQSEIIDSLGRSKDETGFIINQEGHVLSSNKLKEIKSNSNFKNSAIFQSASKKNLSSEFKKDYDGLDGQKYFGSYTLIPEFDNLIVLFQKDTKKIEKQIVFTVIKSLAWSIFLLVFTFGIAYYSSEGITKNLIELTRITKKIATGKFDVKAPITTQDEVGFLSHSINQMAYQIQLLMKSTVEKARLAQELETAKVVQTTFFPKSDIEDSNFSVSGYYKPASECGGDLWGHFQCKSNRHIIFIADAMGHGAPAALVTAMAYSSFMTISNIIKSSSDAITPADILTKMNTVINQAVDGSISITCFVAIIDLENGLITFSNAGHNFPILIPDNPNDSRSKKNNAFDKISNLKPISLTSKGVPLGMDANSLYLDTHLELAAGDKLLLFTDGLIECESPEGKVWTRKKLTERFLTHQSKNYIGIKNILTKEAFDFFGEKPLKDDVTIVVAEISKNWKKDQIFDLQNTLLPDFPVSKKGILSSTHFQDSNEISLNIDLPSINKVAKF